MNRLALLSKLLITVLTLFCNDINAQYIKLDNKLLFSSFYNNKDLSILSSGKVNTYSVAIGADYLQKDWFYLSSQIGYMRIGGKEINQSLQGDNSKVSEIKSYLHINTTFRAYLKASGLNIFLGVGPYVNILSDNSDFDDSLYKPYYKFKSTYVGGKAEIGVTQDINKFRVGIIGDYLYNLSASATSSYLRLNNNTFSGTISVGYRIR